ncbi:MAG TPA: MATE family efflux transporter, partial [Porphyromonadaceae bacterium]|nr:MATE family efflux transporter [Porphyromonadaceae bacterium]
MNLSIQKYFPLYRSIIRVGIPIILGQLGIIVVGFTDNIMVGRYGTDSLAAASFVNNLFNLVFICGMGFSYGLTPLVGRYNGEKRNDRLV